ncbi:MAG: DNRLRE domain-containing protein [Saprospiraceae bacterium]|nr:DNRLRE domain-containing protein [Saprospiraceae bacterium]
MKCNPWLLSLLVFKGLHLVAQDLPQPIEFAAASTTEGGCFRSIFVESPVADTYIASEYDTSSFGAEKTVKVRGLPDRKRMHAMLSYEIHHLDPNYLKKAFLKVFTATKNRGYRLELSGMNDRVNESHSNWKNKPVDGNILDQQSVTDAPFIQFDVTDYVRGHLKDGFINFNLQSDGKKAIEIASRESGLSPELILEMCTYSDILSMKEEKMKECFLKVLPSVLDGKFTIQLVGMPEGGFGDLMLMTEQGNILFQVPFSIQDADVSYHTLDFNNLLPGTYWAVLRKGRIMVKDRFQLRPESGTTHLRVATEILAEHEPGLKILQEINLQTLSLLYSELCSSKSQE